MLYFRTTNKALPEVAYLTIDESNRAGYGEILNGNKLSTSERKLAQRQGEYIRANITAIERNRTYHSEHLNKMVTIPED